ncbi:hypothetical protein [Crocosphaera sp.]|uniref:hypothetical protein n=1 Tax=Crocosphaera sp. TaxID=2729996 RepID=UPI002635FFFE|nr:hypothetical protein [Crocosphaera sp.]MDJ0579069.1 hypothetical protein [Crocosphaera sp.]
MVLKTFSTEFIEVLVSKSIWKYSVNFGYEYHVHGGIKDFDDVDTIDSKYVCVRKVPKTELTKQLEAELVQEVIDFVKYALL